MKLPILLVLLFLYTCSAFSDYKKKFRIALLNLNPNDYWDEKDTENNNSNHLLKVSQKAINQFKDIDLVIYPENALSTNEVETTEFPGRFYPKYPTEMKCPRHFQNKVYYIGAFDFQNNETNIKVIPIMEEEQKTNTTSYYSSNFVLDKENIIARKRRVYLHNYNKHFNSSEDGILIDTFNTSIGQFAYSSHYDFLFSDLDIIKKNKIEFFIVASSAKSVFPFMHVPSLHAGVAIANNLTVFSASIKSEKDYLLGAGIYDFLHGRIGPNNNSLLVEDFPQAKTLQDKVTLDARNSNKTLPESISYQNEELNLKNLDEPTDGCDIKVTFKNPEDKVFYKKATGFNYLNLLEPRNHSIEWGACALVYCPGEKKNCTFPTNLNVKIKYLAVRLTNLSFIQIIPITMESNLNPGQFFVYKRPSFDYFELVSEIEQDYLVTFGFIWSYNKTPIKSSFNSLQPTCNTTDNSVNYVNMVLIILVIILLILLILLILIHKKVICASSNTDEEPETFPLQGQETNPN